jgi:hypothetical protein
MNSNAIESGKQSSDNCDNIYNDSYYIRADNYRSESFQDITTNSENSETNDRNMSDNIVNIYRYKFSNEFTDELYNFSKIHQYDHRKDFKEAWKIWIDDNSELIDDEVNRLTNLGYDGDIIDKMFKSARYYFRKKSTEKKEPVKRRIYVGSQKELLENMDEHIKMNINSGDFKPSEGFDEFCKQNMNLLKEEVSLLFRSGITDSNEIKAKIKKTYKNRYFLIIKK